MKILMNEKLREASGGKAPALQSAASALADYSKKYSYEDLKNKNVPSSVDQANLENYLSDEDFAKVFKVSRKEFEGQPKWKRDGAKKAAKLF